MKILIIDEGFPYPLNTGKRIRSFNLAKYLATNNEVSYLAYGNESDETYTFMTENNIDPYFVRPPYRKQNGLRFYFRLFINLFSPYPYMISSHYTSDFQRRFDQITHAGAYDIVICEGMPYSIFIKHSKRERKIIVAHNIEASIWRGYESNEKNLLKRLYISIQRIKVERFEKRSFGWVDGATAVTDNDAGEIRSYGITYPVEVIYNGVDLEYNKPQNVKIDSNLLVFTGSMDYRANQDAVIYFVHDILPLIRERKPSLQVAFVGRNPPKHIVDLQKIQGVTVTGTVDDVRPYIAGAALYIVPMRIGGGSRLKILEAMAMKKAIVSTSIGASGLKVAHRENIIISDGEQSFADSVINCLDDDELRIRLAENGLSLVEKYYRWDILAEKLNKYLTSIVDRK